MSTTSLRRASRAETARESVNQNACSPTPDSEQQSLSDLKTTSYGFEFVAMATAPTPRRRLPAAPTLPRLATYTPPHKLTKPPIMDRRLLGLFPWMYEWLPIRTLKANLLSGLR